jgi:uncharacterized protein (TIGR03663 family)
MMSQRPKEKKKKRSRHQGAAISSLSDEANVLKTDTFEYVSRGIGANTIIAVILLAGYVLRSVSLDIKPPHFDEGINGNFVAKMWQDGYYRYDPTNFHGPLYFYFLQFTEMFFGRGIVGFRWVNGLISLASVALILKHRRFVGNGAIWAAAMLTFSTGGIFYSRYAIHESLFVLLQILFSIGWFLWESEKSRRSFTMMLAGFFGAFAVKETYFIFFGIWFIAVYFTRIWSQWRGERLAAVPVVQESEEGLAGSFWRERATSLFMTLSLLIGVLATIILYTGFLIHPHGLIDMVQSIAFWIKTGTGHSGHEKPFVYWLQLLFRYEMPGLVGLVFSVPIFLLSRKGPIRIFSLVAFGTWLAYSLIPYKTPWLILNLLWPLALVFGEQATLFRQLGWTRMGVVRWIFLIVPLIWSLYRMQRLNFHEFTNEREPYVYVQSTMTMKTTLDYVAERVRRFPEDLNMQLKVLVRDPWPLPWIFGQYPNLTYGRGDITDLGGSDLVLIDGIDQTVIEAKLVGQFWRVPFQIRDSYEKGFAYLQYEKFKGIVPENAEVFEGAMR